jgi:hypothetical protein
MWKASTAVMAAASIAAVATILTTPTSKLDASPLAAPAVAAMTACAQRPWPYLHCVGTPFGNPHIRLVGSERRAGN